MKIFVNGKAVTSEKQYPLPTETLQFVFESLRSYKGVIFRLTDHLRRLSETAKTIDLKLPKTITELERELKSCLSKCSAPEAFLRVSVDEKNSYVLVTERKRPSWIYEKGIDLKTSVMRKNVPHAVPSEIKTNAFLTNVLATLEKQEENIYEVILLDSNGFITESTVWNLFMVKGGKVFTPMTGILHGVTRQFVIECALLEGIEVVETNLMRHDLWNAEEAFLTNTSGEIVPIRALDARLIGSKIPGELTQKLMSRFQDELRKALHEN